MRVKGGGGRREGGDPTAPGACTLALLLHAASRLTPPTNTPAPCLHLSNYIVEFPKDATPTDKALLINAMIQTDYLLFEATGGDNNGGDNNNNN